LSFVIDASVALAWCFQDEASEYADQALARLTAAEASVPHHWALEVANGLLAAERRGRIRRDESAQLVALLLSLPILPDPQARSRDLTATLKTAREYGLTTYDAGYLELAQRIGAPIATLDSALAEAARRAGPGYWRP
jgi:predicted nucleic acid-binding protein